MPDACACPYVALDEGDVAEFYHKDVIRARKPHKCDECGTDIQKGDTYERVKAKWGGRIETVKTCAVCLEIRSALFCEGFMHHGMREDLRAFIDECFDELPWAKIREMSQPAQDTVLAMVNEKAEEIHELNDDDEESPDA